MNLFPDIKEYKHEYLSVDTTHGLYIEQSGNPNGIPVIFLHGGPGAGTNYFYRRFFDPKVYRIILLTSVVLENLNLMRALLIIQLQT